MESHEITLNGKTYRIRVSVMWCLVCCNRVTAYLQAVRGLCGHSIDRYKIHGSKSVPITTVVVVCACATDALVPCALPDALCNTNRAVVTRRVWRMASTLR
jgi:hypothetical protein